MILRPTLFAVLKRLALAAVLLLPVLMVSAFDETLRSITPDSFKQLRADNWKLSGKTLIVSGNVHLPAKNMELFADELVVSLETRDYEASGNVRVICWKDMSSTITPDQLMQLQKYPNVIVKSVSTSRNILGERTYSAVISTQSDNITADKLIGNMDTSYFRFENAVLSYRNFICRAESGEHRPDGETIVKNGEISACDYLASNSAHYSISASTMKLMPHNQEFRGIENANFDKGDRAVLLTNGFVKIYGVPLVWLPVFYKPKDESPGLFNAVWGRESDWGYYVKLRKKFNFNTYPGVSVSLMADWYEKRGFGFGTAATFNADKSRTEFFFYGIHDSEPTEGSDYDDYRLDVPSARYVFKLSNLTHITPRLDFRGNFSYASDRYVTRDFFPHWYDADPQPVTFAALEQQFDLFSASLYMRVRTNDFYTAVERLPEVNLDMPRTEIFDTGIYYQGNVNAANMRMKWIDFEKGNPLEEMYYKFGIFDKLHDYEAFRFDTTHFLYYPIKNRFFTFIPRAGIKLTAYSKTSKRPVSTEDLQLMFSEADPQSKGGLSFRNYDHKGGSKVRVAGEFGFELSTKLHNSWKNIRSEFFEIDGLRHVIQPYINYTYITDPNVDRKHIYYFDDIDRISEQHFVRFGLVNRVQTRKDNAVSEVFSMENFWDYHFEKEEGASRLGNLGTIIRFKIFKGLTFNTSFLIDLSGDGEVPDYYRDGENAGKVGLALDWLNHWDINLTYKPAKNWEFKVGYYYTKPYKARSAYSMGSTLTMINSTSSFLREYTEYEEGFYVRAAMPITPDHRTFLRAGFAYNVLEGYIDSVSISILRQFHCWQLAAMVEFEQDETEDGHDWEINYSVTANLTGLSPDTNVQNNVLRGFQSLGKRSHEF